MWVVPTINTVTRGQASAHADRMLLAETAAGAVNKYPKQIYTMLDGLQNIE